MRRVRKTKGDADPHRKAVYRWERQWPTWNYNFLTLGAIRRLVGFACQAYKVPTPRVTRHGNSLSWCDVEKGIISMQSGKLGTKGGLNIATAMHEVAHWVVFRRHGRRPQDHGRAFMRVYIDLLVKAGAGPRVAIEASARAAGLHW